MVYAAQYYLPANTGLTVVFTPTIALQEDLLRRFREWQLPCSQWQSDVTLRKGFLLVSSDKVIGDSFMRWCIKNRSNLVSHARPHHHTFVSLIHWFRLAL